ncbi:MAG: hypothetical protein H7338_10830 [Candidatus Sericytochromatia bacterium]|nr:hypothetical protein [Candidatus Sericytochromatia bacterium]
MSGKPTLKTGRLVCPPQAQAQATLVLERHQPATAASALAGKPDSQSAAQRTLHQAMLNRLIGSASVYGHLRGNGFNAAWNWQPENMPQAILNLAIHHVGDGPRLGIILRSGTGRAPYEEDLLQQGWHVLILDPSAVVQTPQDAIDSILAALTQLAGITLGMPARPSDDDDDEQTYSSPNSLFQPLGRPRLPTRLSRLLQMGVVSIFLAGCFAFGMQVAQDRRLSAAGWGGGMAFRARIANIALSPDGHALVSLMNGHKTYVPAHALRRDPNRLHQLIVAWRQGKPLTLFTTATQHREYGRQVGIKDLTKHPPGPQSL